MEARSARIVICGGVRTPIGHFAKSLSNISPEQLMTLTINALLARTKLYPQAVDGAIVGWVGQGSHAPNIARISVLLSHLPEKAHAVTVQANCVSGLEAISSAARRIVMGEGDLYIAGGTESMSTFPYAIRGDRSMKELRSLDMVKANWSSLLEHEGIGIVDCIEEGLTDPVKNLNMAATAEVCAQLYSIDRPAQDQYAAETYRRAFAAEEGGFYAGHTVPVIEHEKALLQKDEYPYLRESLIRKPEMLAKAPLIFESSGFGMKEFYDLYQEYMPGKTYQGGQTKASVTLFNSCARSDGAAAVIVASEKRAKELNLEILGEIISWGYWGNNPAHMGIAPVFAAAEALQRSRISFDELDLIELHEAFSATCLSIFKVGREKYGHHWESKWKDGKLNPNGGSIPLGHPLAATGTRIVLNALYQMKVQPAIRYAMSAACAAGGLGGAMILRKYQ
ncbi:MAG TPA: thiolase family protein [Elusimicrobiota bacterium]|nr:thiolase family protein [Elusimicrobiota bacterium]